MFTRFLSGNTVVVLSQKIFIEKEYYQEIILSQNYFGRRF